MSITITFAELSKSNTPSVAYAVDCANNAPAAPAMAAGRGVGGDQAPVHRRANRMHAPHVLANPGKCLAEGRVDDAPYHVEDQKQQNGDIDVIAATEQIVFEQA